MSILMMKREEGLANSETEIDALWSKLNSGGKYVPANGRNRTSKVLADGTRVNLRNWSSTGGKTIGVFPRGSPNGYKIHIAPGN